MNDDLPDHGRPRTDNLPEGMTALPVLPMAISDEDAAIELAKRVAAAGKTQPEDLPYDADKAFAFRLRVNAFSDAAGAWKDIKTIRSNEQAERLTDFLRGAQALSKQVDEQRMADKKPWNERADRVQAVYKPLIDTLDLMAAWMKRMAGDWMQAEKERKAAEAAAAKKKAAEEAAAAAAELARAEAANDAVGMIEAEAKRAEAANAAKAAEKAEKEKTKMGSASGGGRAVSMRTQAFAVIESQNACYMHFRDHPKVKEVLQALADEAVRGGNVPPGCKRDERKVAA